MKNDMKLIMESWKEKRQEYVTLVEMCNFDEQEMSVFSHPSLEEGVMGLFDRVKNSYERIKNWTKDKVTQFVKKMGNGYISFINNLYAKGKFKKSSAFKEKDAMRLLLTEKHIDLALLILTALFNMVGGYAVEALINAKEKFETFLEVTEQLRTGKFAEAIKTLFGEDPPDVVDIIRKALEYSKDLNDDSKKLKRQIGNFEEFGGLVEVLQLFKS